MVTLEPWVLELLACPACTSALRPVDDAEELACTNDSCGLVYPVRDGVPVLLVDQARKS